MTQDSSDLHVLNSDRYCFFDKDSMIHEYWNLQNCHPHIRLADSAPALNAARKRLTESGVDDDDITGILQDQWACWHWVVRIANGQPPFTAEEKQQ